MDKVIIVRYCEIHLKGNNRGFFERIFAENMERALKGLKHEIRKQSGRYVIEGFVDSDTEDIVRRLKKVFGVHTLSIALKVNTSLDQIFQAVKIVAPKSGTFKVDTHRADKSFSHNSMQINAEIGGRLLDFNSDLSVDVHNPQAVIGIDLRENGTSLVFSELVDGVGGMPVGTAG
ncbi:MAG: tRNA 4-thiouridine(8) synthase ThiI, partial [Clostridia bacterium]|nr:tRNA 4-thiouridine(8) synthase ThiI [Clostridia bacterium]